MGDTTIDFSISVVKNQKRENPYLQIDKQIIEDARLSYGAIGLACRILSKPADWQINPKELSNNSKDSVYAVKKCLDELRAFGYCRLLCIKDEKGKALKWQYIVYETPNEEPQGKSIDYYTKLDNGEIIPFSLYKVMKEGRPEFEFIKQGIKKPESENQKVDAEPECEIDKVGVIHKKEKPESQILKVGEKHHNTGDADEKGIKKPEFEIEDNTNNNNIYILLWQKTKAELKKQLSQTKYSVWISDIVPCGINTNVLTLKTISDYNKSVLESRFYYIIKDAIKEATKMDLDIIFIV